MPTKQADPDLERRWRDHLQHWRSSGLSVRAFCSDQQLPESSFYFWRAELQRRDAARPAPLPFVPVHVVVTPPAAPAAPVPPAAAPLELVAGGVTLLLRAGFDPALLRAVLDALEERPC